MTWQTVHEHIVADAFCSKKCSSGLLVHEQEASQKWYLLNHHSTACGEKNGIYMWTQTEYTKYLITERWHTNAFIFQQHCFLH